jgi:hypothetical protein
MLRLKLIEDGRPHMRTYEHPRHGEIEIIAQGNVVLVERFFFDPAHEPVASPTPAKRNQSPAPNRAHHRPAKRKDERLEPEQKELAL